MSKSLRERLNDGIIKCEQAKKKKSNTDNNGKKDDGFPEPPNRNLDYPIYERKKNKERER